MKAVGDMMESLEPTSFAVDPMHTMFVGFRPLLVGYRQPPSHVEASD